VKINEGVNKFMFHIEFLAQAWLQR
jgi:hypothetical protein